MERRFYRDATGDPRARCSVPHQLLGQFLESDVQGNPAHCRDLLNALDDVAQGRLVQWEETGNAHTLTLTPDRVRIESEVDPQAGDLILKPSEFRLAVSEWMEFLEGRSGQGD